MDRRRFLFTTGCGTPLGGCGWLAPPDRSSLTDTGMNAMPSNPRVKPIGAPPLLAPCGIECGSCPIRRPAGDPAIAETLAADWRKAGRAAARADWFKCQGCRGPEALVWDENCKIRHCCLHEKRLAHCGLCPDFPCVLITQFANDGHPTHRAAVERLKGMSISLNR
ncbi:MAG: DUF3795 domain-containing protein [bacterium]|nr:DUF3795 domain-containing protein [bacterium]